MEEQLHVRIGVLMFDRMDSLDMVHLLESLGVDAERCSPLLSTKESLSKYDGLVLPGTHGSSVYEMRTKMISKEVEEALLETKVPILGVCFGQQLLVVLFGGEVEVRNEEDREDGLVTVHILEGEAVGIFNGFSPDEQVWMKHRDVVSKLPKDFKAMAFTDKTAIAGCRHVSRDVYGLIWHPETQVLCEMWREANSDNDDMVKVYSGEGRFTKEQLVKAGESCERGEHLLKNFIFICMKERYGNG